MAALFLLEPGIASFSDRAIGIAVVSDSSLLARLYAYVLALTALTALCCAYFLFSNTSPEGNTDTATDPTLFGLLSLCAGLNLLGAFVTGDTYLYLATAILSQTIAVFWLARNWLAGKAGDTPGDSREFLRHLCLSWQGTLTLFLLLKLSSMDLFWLAWCLSLVTILALPRLVDTAAMWRRITALRGTGLAYWVLLAPLLYLAANELHFMFLPEVGDQATQPLHFFWLSLAVILLPALARSTAAPGPACCAASVLVTGIAVNEYVDQLVYTSFDMFHFAEKVLPLQQWQSYGKLPFIDYLPTHGLADALPQFLYQLISGRDYLESMIWGNGHFQGWLMRALAVLILFLFLRNFLSGVTAFFLIWLLPSYHLIEPYFTLLLLPAMHMLARRHYESLTRWWLVQWLIVFALFLWRLDFGIAASAASILVAALEVGIANRQASGWRPAVLTLALAAASMILIMLAMTGTVDPALMKAYLFNQVTVISLAQFHTGLGYDALVQYVVLPGTTAVLLAFTISSVIKHAGNARDHRIELALIILGALTMVLSLRSLQRHSLYEGDFNTYLHLLFGLLFICHYWRGAWRIKTPFVACVFIMLTALVMPTAREPMLRYIYHPSVKHEYTHLANQQALPKWRAGMPRMVNRAQQYADFLIFTNRALESGEAFYDFSNAPLLYAQAGIELPVPVFQNIYQSSHLVQQRTIQSLEELRSARRLPFIVFRQGRISWDQVDGVDNALRSYAIAEYIYQHYRPCVRISGLELWSERTATPPGDCLEELVEPDSLPLQLRERIEPLAQDYLAQDIAFAHLPYIWARYDTVEEVEERALALQIAEEGERLSKLLPERAGSRASSPAYLDLRLTSASNQQVVVTLGSGAQLSFVARSGSHDYRVRISALWDWFRANGTDELWLEAERPLEVQHARIVELALQY